MRYVRPLALVLLMFSWVLGTATAGVKTFGLEGSGADITPMPGEAMHAAFKRALFSGSTYILPGTYQFTAPVEGTFHGVRIMGSNQATLVPAATTSTTYTSETITVEFGDTLGGVNTGKFIDSSDGFGVLALQPGDVFLVSGALSTGTNNTYWVCASADDDEIFVVGATTADPGGTGVLTEDASEGETVVFTKIPVGLFNFTGDNITLDGFTIGLPTSPSDFSCAVRLGGDNVTMRSVKQRGRGAATTLQIGTQFIPTGGTLSTGCKSQQNVHVTDCNFTSVETATGLEQLQLIAAGNSILNYSLIGDSFTRDVQSINTTSLLTAVRIEKAGKGTIVGCNWEGLATAGAWLTNNSPAEGQHFAMAACHLELGTAVNGYIDLNGARFIAITGCTFGRLSSDTGAINIGASADGGLGQDVIVSACHFHNIGTTQGAATGTIIANSINDLMIEGNNFGICTGRQVLLGTAVTNAVVRNNVFAQSSSASTTISSAIECVKSTDAGYVVSDNITYANGGTWHQTAIFGAAGNEVVTVVAGDLDDTLLQTTVIPGTVYITGAHSAGTPIVVRDNGAGVFEKVSGTGTLDAAGATNTILYDTGVFVLGLSGVTWDAGATVRYSNYKGKGAISTGTVTSITISSNVISRAAGSFITNGFRVGDIVVLTGLGVDTAADIGKTLYITALTATAMTVSGNTLSDDAVANTTIVTKVGSILTPSLPL